MKKILAMTLAATSLALTAPASAQSEQGKDSRPDIVDAAVGAPDLSTLVTAVTAAELVELLRSNGPFTVLAPINSAFADIQGTVDVLLQPENKADLQDVLAYHVIEGRLPSGRVTSLARRNALGADVEMLNGDTINILAVNGELIITDGAGNESKIIATDITTSNGVVHLIDGVLIPPAD